MSLSTQVAWLFLLALPVACISWTVTHEEVFRELRESWIRRSREGNHWYQRKFFYLLTCEYCFSHYIALGFVAGTGYKLLAEDAWGYVIGLFALVWVANQYMSGFGWTSNANSWKSRKRNRTAVKRSCTCGAREVHIVRKGPEGCQLAVSRSLTAISERLTTND